MVLLPGPMMQLPPGPPTSFALRMRPWLLAVFILLLLVAIARFASLDIMGGFVVVLTVVIGWYSIRDSINVSWLLCLAIVLALNAMFDAIIMITYLMKVHGQLFEGSLPWYANLIRAAIVAGPVLELVGAVMCWQVYKDHVVNLPNTEFFGFEEQSFESYGSFPPGGRPPAGAHLAGSQQGSRPLSAARFEAFQGVGRKLSG